MMAGEVLLIDLSTPPQRAAVGMAAGATVVSHQRDDREAFPVRLRLPWGVELAVEARLLTIDSMGRPDPPTGPPSTLDLHAYPESLADGYQQMLAVARRFALDAAEVTAWYQEAGEPPTGAAAVRSGWLSAEVGSVRLEVRATYRPPAGEVDAQTTVHYVLTW